MDSFTAQILASGIVWIPYSLLLLYLCYEHYQRGRNLQSQILFLLFLGSAFRCAWFWFYFSFVHYVISEVINRLAMLFQFSGLTVLMLMWIRAISIAKLTDTAYNETSRNIIALSKDTVAPGIKDKAIRSQERRNRVQRYQEASQAVLSKVTADNLFKRFYLLTGAVNFVVWVFVLASLANKSQRWYDINIISISMVCLAIAFTTLFVGVRVSLALHVALSPVYMSNEGAAAYNQEQVLKCVCMGRYGATCEYVMGCCGLCDLYSFIFNKNKSDTRQGLQMQREVLKVILSVSTITSFFFLIRAFCFLYRPVVEDTTHTEGYDASWSYPFFFYQIPELVPNLVIAMGISPPNGVLRQAARFVIYGARLVASACYCGEKRYLFSQQSAFDNGTPQPSFDNRTSVMSDAHGASLHHGSLTSLEAGALPSVVTATATGAANSNASKAAGRRVDQNENMSPPPLSPKARFQEPVEAMERGEVHSPVHAPVHVPAPAERSAAIRILTPEEQAQQRKATTATAAHKGSSTTLSFASHSSLGGQSLNSGTGGGSVGSSSPRRGKGAVAVSLRKNAARGTWEAHMVDVDAGSEDEESWNRERRDSAEIAEMIYRINSFSTADESDGAARSDYLSSSPVSSLTSNTRGSSVGSNTIHNSRRHFITNPNGTQKPNPNNSNNKKNPDFFEKKSKGWFF